MITSDPLSFLTSSTHLEVFWKETLPTNVSNVSVAALDDISLRFRITVCKYGGKFGSGIEGKGWGTHWLYRIQ